MIRPEELAVRFLRLVEERDLDAAEALLAEEVTFVYPGGVTYDNLRRCVSDGATRYMSIEKDIADVQATQDGTVFVSGTLNGVANDGEAIRDVRFIDRFTFSADDRIVRHDVWNDLPW